MPDIERELCTCGRPPTDLEARMLPVIRERDEARAEVARLRAAAKRVLEAESATPPVVWQDYLDALEAVDKLAHALRNEEAEVARLREERDAALRVALMTDDERRQELEAEVARLREDRDHWKRIATGMAPTPREVRERKQGCEFDA